MKRRMGPLRHSLDIAMLHRVDMAIIHVRRIILFIANHVFPKPTLPSPAFGATSEQRYIREYRHWRRERSGPPQIVRPSFMRRNTRVRYCALRRLESHLQRLIPPKGLGHIPGDHRPGLTGQDGRGVLQTADARDAAGLFDELAGRFDLGAHGAGREGKLAKG